MVVFLSFLIKESYLVNHDKQIIKINPAFEKKSGYQEADLRFKPIHTLHPLQHEQSPFQRKTEKFDRNHLEREIILKAEKREYEPASLRNGTTE